MRRLAIRFSLYTIASVQGQGGWEDDESVESAAQRETVEEAGVRGVLEVRTMQLWK